MIDIVAHIVSALEGIGVRVVLGGLSPTERVPDQYITFLEISAVSGDNAGDQELGVERTVQLNIWSTSNYHKLSQKVARMMSVAGYERIFEHDGEHRDGDTHFNRVHRYIFYDDVITE